MKFAYTFLYVPDVGRAVEFYERALGFQRGFIHGSGEYGELQQVKRRCRSRVSRWLRRTSKGE